MAMAMSSWNSSLHAYGMCTCTTHRPTHTSTPLPRLPNKLADYQAPQNAAAYREQYHDMQAKQLCAENEDIGDRDRLAGRNAHLHDAGGVLAGGAVELVLLQVCHRKEAAAVAHMHPIRVALVKQPLLQYTTQITSCHTSGKCNLLLQTICAPLALVSHMGSMCTA